VLALTAAIGVGAYLGQRAAYYRAIGKPVPVHAPLLGGLAGEEA